MPTVMLRSLRRSLPVVLAAAVLVVVPAAAGAAQFVGLGDSSASGPLIPNQTLAHPGCGQSDHNYAHLAAARLGLTLDDRSCGGATTEDMTAAQGAPALNPPQFDALDAGTEVVTVQISGNDIGLFGLLLDCISVLPVGHPCTDRHTAGGDDMLPKIAAAAPKLAAVLEGIHARSPDATVVVVSYPTVLPASAGCWPLTPIAPGDIPYIRSVGDATNVMLATQAAAHGALFADAHEVSKPYNACTSPATRWTEPIVPLNLAAPWHPNATGEAGMADLVVAALS